MKNVDEERGFHVSRGGGNVWRGGGVQLVQVAAGGSFPRLGQMSTGFRMTPTILLPPL